MSTENSLDLKQRFRLGSYVINPSERLIDSADGHVQLEPKVMQVLLALVRNAGQVVSRDAIFDQVWPGAIISDEALSRCIYQLRKHLRTEPNQQPFIKTILKKGYRLTVMPEPVEATPRPAAPQIWWQRRWPMNAGLAGLLLAGLLYFWPATRTIENVAQPPDIPQSPGPAVAVLPFIDLSGDEDKTRLSDAFPEDLLIGLGRLRSLQISSWASSRRFRLDEHSTAQVGRELNVDALLTGTITIEDNRIRIGAELVDVESGNQIWADVYNNELGEMHTIQDAIAHEVVRVLDVESKDFRIDRLTDTVAAHELYAEGRYYLNRRNAGSLRQAIQFFGLAIDADPHFAEALTGLADAHILSTQYQRSPLAEATRVAQAAVDRALALDPALAEAIASQGLIYLHNRRYDDAANTLRRAAAMNPNYANAHNWLGRAVELQGHYQQALEAYRRGLRLDPFSTILNLNVARTLTHTGNVSRARPYLETILKHDPDFPNTYWALAFNSYIQGDLDEAARQFQKSFDLGLQDPYAMATYACVHGYRGDFEQALAWLDRSQAKGQMGQTIVPRARLYAQQQQFDAWSEYAQQMISLDADDPRYRYMAAQAQVFRNDYATAVALFEQGMALDPDRTAVLFDFDVRRGGLFALDYALALQGAGDNAGAELMLADTGRYITRLRESGLALPGLDYTQAALEALRGRESVALTLLQRAAASGWPGVRSASLDPKFARLRDNAEFQALTTALTMTRRVRQ